MVNNCNLHAAKKQRDDEFYTTYETIEEELKYYFPHFVGKTVLCNCDNPFDSNFCRYFLRNFNLLGLKRLICTSYYKLPMDTQTKQLYIPIEGISSKLGYLLDVDDMGDSKVILSDAYVDQWLIEHNSITRLKGDGDFSSEECICYLQQADIVVTNPPFSLFKEMVELLMIHHKSFLLIGNQNAFTYKEIFPLIQKGKVWTGYKCGDMHFRVPSDSKPRKTRFWIDEAGQKWRSIGNAMWLTNLDIERKHKMLHLKKHYSPLEYPNYDNFDAINVKRVADIPKDYPGIMGVPVTIINKYNPMQFEIIGEANHGSDSEFDLFKPLVDGKLLFKRILIRNRML